MRSTFIRHSNVLFTCTLLLFGVLVCCRGCADDVSPYQRKGVGLASYTTSATAALMWQGMHFHWLREVVGFETPHRLGSVASYITNTTEYCSSRSCRLSGNYTVQFSPGVDGDYAFPVVYYSGFASGNGSQVRVLSGNWSFTFQDNSSSHPVLHSDTLLHFNASMVLQQPLGASQAVEVGLQGFQMEMMCVETPEHSCNSNAIWPYHFNLSFAGVCQTHAQGKIITCPLLFALGRGWTPSHGGGKPYNYEMAYNITIHYTAVVYQSTATASWTNVQRIHAKSDTHQPPLTGKETITNATSAKHSVIYSLKEFSWTLLETDNHKDRGRYLEELVFSVEGLAPHSSELQYQWTMGFRAPRATTYLSDVEYSMVVAALVLSKQQFEVEVSPTLTANGTICKDDKVLFHCSTHGLKQQLCDVVTVLSQL